MNESAKNSDSKKKTTELSIKNNQPVKPITHEELLDHHFNNPQLDLFQTFLCNPNDKEDYSNTIDIWDSVPRYSISRQEMVKRRNKYGGLDLLNLTFSHRGQMYSVIIQPAKIEDNGQTIEYYPSANEELVEDVLRKIATNQQSGFLDSQRLQSGVVFSLYELREELAARGHTRSFQEIVKSLNILQRSHIEIRLGLGKGKSFIASNYLSALASVSLEQLKEDPNAKWVAQFHPLVTDSICNILSYRQYNYAVMMGLTTQLARWLHKLLSSKFIFASLTGNPFELHYSTIKRDSNLLNRGRERDNRSDVEIALLKLKEAQILSNIKSKAIIGKFSKVTDVIYTLYPSIEFIKEIKVANKRSNFSPTKNNEL